MRILTAALALAFLTSASVSAMARALTEQEIEGVKQAITEMPGECTVEVENIQTGDGDGYEAEAVTCKDGKYNVSLDSEAKITEKVKTDE